MSSLSSPNVSSPSSTSSRTVAPSMPVTCCAFPWVCGCPCMGGGGAGICGWPFALPPIHVAPLIELGALWLRPGPPPCMCACVELAI